MGGAVYFPAAPFPPSLLLSPYAHTLSPLLPASRARRPTAPCEQAALTSYYANLLAAPCLVIPSLENWKCLVLGAPPFPPIGSTQALVIIILLAWFGGYWYHMKVFGGHGLDLLIPIVEGWPVVGDFLKKHFGNPNGSAISLK